MVTSFLQRLMERKVHVDILVTTGDWFRGLFLTSVKESFVTGKDVRGQEVAITSAQIVGCYPAAAPLGPLKSPASPESMS